MRPETRYTYSQVTSASGALVYMPKKVAACQTLASCTNAADETQVTAAYNSNLLPTSITRRNGTGTLAATTAMTYDPRGNTITVDGPLSGTADTWAYKYDSGDRVVGAISPDPDGAGALKNRAVKLSYTGWGQLYLTQIGTTAGQSGADWANFSEAYHRFSQIDPNGRIIRQTLWSSGTDYAVADYLYDSLGRLSCGITYMNPAVWGPQATSCAPLQTTGPYGPDRVTQNVYDAASQVTQVKVALGTTAAATERTLSYTNDGMLATLKDGEANLTTFEYDGFDRLAKTRYPDLTKGSGTSSTTDYEQLGYDANSNVTSRRLRNASSIGFSYDNLDRVTLKNLPGSEPDVSYSYDNLGRTTQVSVPGYTVTLGWDALSRQVLDGQGWGSIARTFDAAGRLTRTTWWDGFYIQYDRLVTGEMTKARENGATSGAGVLAAYGYDDLGNRTSLTRGNGAVTTYGYDQVSRLASITDDLSGTTYDQTIGFTYNPASQIVTRTSSNDAYAFPEANVSTAYTSNGLNELATIGGAATAHDANGNLTSDPASGRTFGYSSENQLKSASGGTTLYYDGLGRLTEYDTSVSRRFMYDGPEVAVEVDNPTSNVVQRFIRGDSSDELIAWYNSAGTRFWPTLDERGSPMAITDGTGAAVEIERFDEYGTPASGNTATIQYTGQMWLPEVAAYNYKARMYAPGIGGRFLQTDPIGYAGGVNLYAYVGNDPVNLVDPLGLDRGITAFSCPIKGCEDIYVTRVLPPLPRFDFVGSITGRVNIDDFIRSLKQVYRNIERQLERSERQRLRQCMVNFLNKFDSSVDWSKVEFVKGGNIPTMAATTFGYDVMVSRGAWPPSTSLILHELGHVPQWASGELTYRSYMGQLIGAIATAPTLSKDAIHQSIPMETEADVYAAAIAKAYDNAGKPCG